jgi:hypothetical protein
MDTDTKELDRGSLLASTMAWPAGALELPKSRWIGA